MWRFEDAEELRLPNVHLDLPSWDLGKRRLPVKFAGLPSGQTTPPVQHHPMKLGTRSMQRYHAHIYFVADTRPLAETLHRALQEKPKRDSLALTLFVGSLKEAKAGPHPQSQFEVHFMASALPAMRDVIRASGLTALLHPLTDDDLADHTHLAEWIGDPLTLDLSTLDPPGHNRGVARFGKSDF